MKYLLLAVFAMVQFGCTAFHPREPSEIIIVDRPVDDMVGPEVPFTTLFDFGREYMSATEETGIVSLREEGCGRTELSEPIRRFIYKTLRFKKCIVVQNEKLDSSFENSGPRWDLVLFQDNHAFFIYSSTLVIVDIKTSARIIYRMLD